MEFDVVCKCGKRLRARLKNELTIEVDPCEECMGKEREKTANSILKHCYPFNL